MRSLKILLLTAAAFTMLHGVSYAEMPEPLRNVKVTASAIFNKAKSLYEYKYSVTNPTSNILSVNGLKVDISLRAGGKRLSSEGLEIIATRNPQGTLVTRGYIQEVERQGTLDVNPIPVGMSPPEGWSSGVSRWGTAQWGSRETTRILPGGSLAGYTIISRGIPAIRQATVRPAYIVSFDEIFATGISKQDFYARQDEIIMGIYNSIAFHVKTIGPTAPPAVLNPAEFVDSIIKMKHEATELGWITNAGIVRSLDQKLDAVKKKLSQNSTKAAKNILGAFIAEVEAQSCGSHDKCPKGKHILPEAEALLKYNAMHLRDNL